MLRVLKRGNALQIAGSVEGQRVRVSPRMLAGVTDRRTAEVVRIELERRLMQRASAVPFRVVCEEYLAHRRVASRGTENMVRRLAEAFGDEDASRFDLAVVKGWCTKLRHSPGSVVRYVNQTKAIVNWGQDAGMYKLEGPLKVALPQEPDGRDRFLSSWAEVEALASKASPWFRPFVMFLFSTGARLGEARGLRGRDAEEGGVVFVTRKGNGRARKRVVPLEGEAGEYVAKRLVRVKADELVFVTDKGGFLHDPIVYREWNAMCERAGVRDFTPHDARRTFATLLIRKGVDSQVIRQLLGHDCEGMLKRYAYLAPNQLAAAVVKVMC